MHPKEAIRLVTPPLLWEAARRLRRMEQPPEDDPVLHAVHGAELWLDASHALPRIVAAHPLYDTALPQFARFLLEYRRRLSIIDVGANIGDTARLIASQAGRDCVKFLCVEADESYLPLLRRNTADLDVAIHHVIAGAMSSQISASIKRTGGGTSAIGRGKERRRVVTLDELAGGKPIDIVKIDTDGYEAAVLEGARRVLTYNEAACFIEFSPWHIRHYGNSEPGEVIRLLRSTGHTAAIVYDNPGYPMGLFDLTDEWAHNMIGYCQARPQFYVDLLAAKDRAMLARFYETELRRYPSVTWDH